jgi:predicted transcriptional regulator
MDTPTSTKLDFQMKQAFANLAKEQFVPVTSLIKQAIAKYLQEQGIDWRQDKPEKKPKK